MRKNTVGRSTRGRSTDAPLTVRSATDLAATYGDDDVDDAAYEAGTTGIHDPDERGDNARDDMRHELEHGADVADALIGHRLFDLAVVAACLFDRAAAKAMAAATRAWRRLSRYRKAALDLIALERRIQDDDWAIPTLIVFFFSAAALGASGLGELLLNAIAFSVFGLSDKPFLTAFPVFNELTAAGIAITLAIIGIAHIAGHVLRMIGTSESGRTHHFAILGVLVLGEAGAIVGLSIVREAYLAAMGAPSSTLLSVGFILVQVGIAAFTAALSWHFAHPYLWVWTRARVATRYSEWRAHRTERRYRGLVAVANGSATRLQALLPQAVHHSGATRATAKRQWSRYVRRVLLSMPEPVTTAFFDDETVAAAAERTQHLGRKKEYFDIGEALPTREPLTTADFDAAVTTVREELDRADDDLRGFPVVEAEATEQAHDDSAPALEGPTDEEMDRIAREAVASVGDPR